MMIAMRKSSDVNKKIRVTANKVNSNKQGRVHKRCTCPVFFLCTDYGMIKNT